MTYVNESDKSQKLGNACVHKFVNNIGPKFLSKSVIILFQEPSLGNTDELEINLICEDQYFPKGTLCDLKRAKKKNFFDRIGFGFVKSAWKISNAI